MRLLTKLIKETLQTLSDSENFVSVGSLRTGAGVAAVFRNPELTSEDTAKRVLRMLSSLPSRELSKSTCKRIEIFDNPEDVTARLESVGIFDSDLSNGAFDFDSGTLYACVWDGYSESPRTVLHEFGHSIVGPDEDSAEAWYQNYTNTVSW